MNTTTEKIVTMDSPEDIALADRMNAGRKKIEAELAKLIVGQQDIINNFDVAYDPTRDRFFMIRERHHRGAPHDLEIDSIDAVDLIERVRRVIGRKVSPEDFRSVRTVGDLVQAAGHQLLVGRAEVRAPPDPPGRGLR